MKIKTTKGTINNNTTKHKITRDTATIFNFNIDNVTLANNTLTVTCTTITNETITYTLNLANGEKKLPTALENLNVAGDINLFLAIAYKLYETGLEPKPVTGDTDLILGTVQLQDTKLYVNEAIIDKWQEADDKSTIDIGKVYINAPRTGLEVYAEGTSVHTTVESTVITNQEETTINDWTISIDDDDKPCIDTYATFENPIPVAEDHLLVFECTINNPTGDNVTINATLNLDTKEWTEEGGFY